MEVSSNPFIVGKVVTGEAFADRKTLLEELLLDVISGQNIIIFGPRRIGKTSLVRELLKKAKDRHAMATIYIDLLRHDSIEQIAGQIFHQLAGSVDKAVELARSVIKGVSIRFDESSLELALSSGQDLFTRVFNFLESKSDARKRIVVVFDEFQEIETIAASKVKVLRSVIQHHENISYIFTGSKQRLVEFFTSNDHPFYKFGKVLHVGKPERQEMIDFIRQKFKNTGFGISEDVAARIVELTSNLPYFTQMLAHESWNLALLSKTDTITFDLIDQALAVISQRLQVEHESTWSLLTRNQRTACKILVSHQTPYQRKILQNFNISQSSLQQSIASLIEKQIIWKKNGELEFLDPFFRNWIKEQFHL